MDRQSVAARVEASLDADPRTADAPISVSGMGGEVTLEGTVKSVAIRTAAEEIAKADPGVFMVVNELRVGSSR